MGNHTMRDGVDELAIMTMLYKISLLRDNGLEDVLMEIVDAAITICGSDFGCIQLIDPTTNNLKFVASRNLPDWWLNYWSSVPSDQATYGTSLQENNRIIVEDIEQSPNFTAVGLEVQLKAGIRACQSTPIVGRSGQFLGMFSNHYRSPHRPSEGALKFLDLLAVQAVNVIERDQMQRALEESARAKDEFLAIVSHELRTPLNAILGWSTLLKDQATDPALVNPLRVIHRNAQAQLRIIDDILDVSRVIAGKFHLEVRPTDLVAVARNAVETILPIATQKNLRLFFHPELPTCYLEADSDRLLQAIGNILSNAVKFSNPGGAISVVLMVKPSHIVLSITDGGVGIDAKFLPHIFEQFRQVDSSTTRRAGGLGLGLAIVHRIVELHNGRVTAESPGLGRGSVFTIKLPIRTSGSYSRLAPKSSKHLISLDEIRVLVVDDEPDARELLAVMLSNYGAKVLLAASAAEGFEMLQRERPHVLISDVSMPIEDGYSFMGRVRNLPPERGGRTPSIALTAFAGEDNHTKAIDAGFTNHLGKPIHHPDILASTVANLAFIVNLR